MHPLLGSILFATGVALVAGGLLAIRLSGARPGIARRFAGARQLRVGDLVGGGQLPTRPVRVSGRIRCPDPIVTGRDERLVALHRDVRVKVTDGGWRSIERIRDTRGFELFDHDGSLALDPALAAEPLVVIPHVWRGTTAALEDPSHRAAAARLGARDGVVLPADSVTRMVSVVERLLVLARAERDADGTVALRPPRGGFVISALEVADAMRLLGGPRRGMLLAGYGLLLLGAVIALVAAGGLLLAA